jgi:hypothetical protein
LKFTVYKSGANSGGRISVREPIIRKIPYGGWDNCIQLTNGVVELIVTVDVGPRIIKYGFLGEVNEMCEVETTMGLTGGDDWKIYGGHRLWHSPETIPRTYEPDNHSVEWEEIPGGIRTIQELEKLSGIRKEMEIVLSPEGTRVRILHRLTNKGRWPVELSVWSITAMAAGGKEIVPQSNHDTGLLPNRLISLWPYARLDDPRVHWGDRYITLTQDPDNRNAFKFGIPNESGWAAYFNHGHLFVKYYTHIKNASYPDFGVSYETYVNDFMLEIETLSPLNLLKPGSGVTHVEEWELFDGVPMISDDEEEIEEVLKVKLRNKI